MRERWKPIVGYDGKYEVSNLGRIRGPGYGTKGRHVLPRHIMKLQPFNRWGHSEMYYAVGLCGLDHKTRLRTVHSLVAEAFISPRPPGNVINHIDCNGTNNCVSNLEWVTPAENAQHCVRMGRHATMRGERNGMSKLTAKQVKEIIKLLGPIRPNWQRGMVSQSVLARRFGVTPSAIYYVYRRQVWKHVTQ